MTRGPAVGGTVLGLGRRLRAERREIVAFQDALLRRLVRHAYDRVPHYRETFDRAGVDPRSVRGTADLARIPITTKAELREQPVERIVARGLDPRRLFTVRTSGSSGHPFNVYRTWRESGLQYLLRLRTSAEFGIGVTDRIAAVGLIRSRDPRDRKIAGRLMAAVGLKRKRLIDGLAPPDVIAAELRAWRPEAIFAMSGMLCRVAEYLLRHEVRDIRPRAVVVSGEVTTPRMRSRLEAAFDAPVFEAYASHEVPLLGWQCRETGAFHVCDDGVILEVLRDGVPVRPGETGEVVVTNLHAYAMPLIRYRLADMVTRGDDGCACGRPFATIGAIQGRTVDLFPLADGRVITPYEVLRRTVRDDEHWIAQYQLLQERRDRIVLRIVPLERPSREHLARLEMAARAVLGPQVEFAIVLVDDLPLEATGKFRPQRSLVHTGYDEVSPP